MKSNPNSLILESLIVQRLQNSESDRMSHPHGFNSEGLTPKPTLGCQKRHSSSR